MKTWLLITVLIIGLHAKDLQGISRDEFRKEGVELPRNILRLGRYCLRGEKLDRIVERIENPVEAKPALFACAFIAFQKSEKKVTPKYNSSTVNMRFKNFVQCVRDVARYNEEDDAAEYGVNMFCDMTEEEKAEYSGRVIPPDGSEPVGRDGDEYETDRKPGDSEIAVAGGGDVIGGDEITLSETLGTEELRARDVHLPSGHDSVSRSCDTSDPDEIQALGELAGNTQTEDAYICAFVAFQTSELKYSDSYNNATETDMRYNLFKKCVDRVYEENQDEDQTHVSGINFFCDLTPEESKLYYGGRFPSDDGEMEEEGTPPSTLSREYLESKTVFLPGNASWIESYCYDDEALTHLSLLASEANEEKAYACAFVSFQASNMKTTPTYTRETVDLRFSLFVECVDRVEEINAQNLTWTAAVNFFCDMTEEEKFPYFNGLRLPESEIKDASADYDFPMLRGKTPMMMSIPPSAPLFPSSFNQTEDFDTDACVNGDVELLAEKQNKEEKDYVCAFLAFQNSTIKTTDPYENEEEADMRYSIFKNSLIQIDEINAQDLGWTAGITLFVDMSDEERNGSCLRIPDYRGM